MKYDLPSLVCLPAFEAAARRKSFTKAAEELCVTQAAISFQVRNLERSLGVVLFERRHRALKLTRAGSDLHRAVQSAFSRLSTGKASITGRKPNHSFTISAPISFCSKWLVPRLHRLHEEVPGITLLIDANDTMLNLDDGSVDLAIRYSKTKPSTVNAELMVEDGIVPVCSPFVPEPPGHALALGDLEKISLLHDQMLDVTWTDWLKKAGVKREISSRDMSFSHTGHAIDAAVSGRGLALGRLPLIVDDLLSGRLVKPFTTISQSEYAYYLLRTYQSRGSRELDRIVAWLQAESEKTAKALY